MMTCANCGQAMAGSDTFCGKCGAPAAAAATGIIVERGPADDALTAVRPMAESAELASAGARITGAQAGVPAMAPVAAPPASPPRFRLAVDEAILKTYEAVQLTPGLLRRKRGQGTLYVTDARVVFYAWVYPHGTQRESWLLQQTKLEDISGLYASVSRRISVGLLMLTIFFGLATLGTLISLFFIGTFIFAILTVASIFFLLWDAARRGDVGVTISSRQIGTSPIAFGHQPRKGFAEMLIPGFIFRSHSAADVLYGDPAEDADRLIHELGALILDLQTRGRMAYPHWGIPDVSGNGHAGGAL